MILRDSVYMYVHYSFINIKRQNLLDGVRSEQHD